MQIWITYMRAPVQVATTPTLGLTDGPCCTLQDMQVAFSFCKPGSVGPWVECQLGRKMRALLVCEVNKEVAVTNDQGLPEKYIVIKAAGQVRVRYVLLYVDDRPASVPQWQGRQPQVVDSGTMLIIIYGLLLAAIGLSYNTDSFTTISAWLRSWQW